MEKDLKTTVIGALLAVIIAIQPIITQGKIDWGQLGLAALIAALGYFTKDKSSNVPGTK
ncbi:hypothetical protein [Pedobacter sp. NJ-S-72]